MLIGLLTNAFLLILIVAFMIAEVYSFPRKIHYRLQLGPALSGAFENFAGVTRTFLFTLTWLALSPRSSPPSCFSLLGSTSPCSGLCSSSS